jgi:hypothetical protein
MACEPEEVYQVTNLVGVGGGVANAIKVAKCSGGRMRVKEIAVQVVLGAGATPGATIQFFEGRPSAQSIGNPISLQCFVQQYQLWSKPGKVVKDDVYIVIIESSITLNVECRTEALND